MATPKSTPKAANTEPLVLTDQPVTIVPLPQQEEFVGTSTSEDYLDVAENFDNIEEEDTLSSSPATPPGTFLKVIQGLPGDIEQLVNSWILTTGVQVVNVVPTPAGAIGILAFITYRYTL